MHRILPLAALLSTAFMANAQTFSAVGGDVPDDGTTMEFPVEVAGLVPNTIDTVGFGLERVCINATHTWISDFEISIIAPDGTTALLVGGVGWDTDAFTNTCLGTDATTNIADGAPPYSGTFRPQGQMGVVNNGQDGNGTWRIRVRDTYPFADEGSLDDVSITFSDQPATYFVLHSSNLPIVVINTGGVSIPNEPKINVHMGVIDNGFGNINNATDPFNDFDGTIGIELRGNSSQMFPKKSYSFEIRDSLDADMEHALVGLPEESDWILSANYSDKSLLNNPITFWLGEQMGHYAPRWRHVEVILDGAYIGTYVLMEKIKRDNNRVDIAELQPDDISGDELTGGYLFKIDWAQGEFTGGWTSNYAPTNAPGNETIDFYYDEPAVPTAEQAEYIAAYVDSFETALAGPDFADPDIGFRKYADEASFIDFMLVNELSRNVDGYRLSTFLYKDKNSNGGKLHIGPLWDFDLAWRNADYCRGNDHTGWAYLFNYDCPGGKMVPFWWERFQEDSAFVNHVRCRWSELRTGLLSIGNLHSWCDSMKVLLQQSAERNFQIWPILGTYVWPNPAPIPGSYTGEVSELKSFIGQRLQWMDNNIGTPCAHAGVNEPEVMEQLVVYPNPSTGSITVPWNASQGEATLLVQDPQGRTLAYRSIRKATAIDLSDLAKGVYVLKVTDRNGIARQARVVLE